ncbi:unnamed protein product [Didymodactylos carnosus]|uniref:Uncharacterized protein n=2 Tax=Didymodactylos carnosus TaxID=1234261 RepID=A0A815TWS1_9BILA|nr:unnamed protein product [Didymodactylos carnosus]CAF4373035.1 unnamed protein product [Didymodactylos carnosus]
MATNKPSVFNFLNVTESMNTINRERLEEIRSAYANMNDTEPIENTTNNEDAKIKLLADKFSLMNDAENLVHLNKCISEQFLDVACHAILGEYLRIRTIEQRKARRNQSSPASSTIPKITTEPIAQASEASMVTKVLPQVFCQILLKKNRASMLEFCQDFLLCPLAKAASTRR